MTIENGLIQDILAVPPSETVESNSFLLPGFIDAHVHIESSMLIPSEFARLAVVHGTVATVSDPHEIANVCGVPGVFFMIENGSQTPFLFYFGAPSCVPATLFETAGARLGPTEVSHLLSDPRIHYLSEMMNFPGVLQGDPEVMEKINTAQLAGKPVDGHAPGLRGEHAKRYIERGISTDHECFTREEALDKLKYGMKIIIREGSAAKNFEALVDLLNDYPDRMMFCSDDKHPDSLVEGHINRLCARAIAKGIPLFNVLRAACLNPVLHYQMEVGLLRKGDRADFIRVSDLKEFEVLETYIGGTMAAQNGKSLVERIRDKTGSHPAIELPSNPFHCDYTTGGDFLLPISDFLISEGKIPVIEALDGQLITNKIWMEPKAEQGNLVADPDSDLLKIAVINRYRQAPVSLAFVKGFGIREGAIASSVAHDSHNIVAVGTSDDLLAQAVNMVIRQQGGVSFVNENTEMVLPLPVAGLMSLEDGYQVAELYSLIDQEVKKAGTRLAAPYMTLSFMALLVIPHLKLSDLGLFDGDQFSFLNKTRK